MVVPDGSFSGRSRTEQLSGPTGHGRAGGVSVQRGGRRVLAVGAVLPSAGVLVRGQPVRVEERAAQVSRSHEQRLPFTVLPGGGFSTGSVPAPGSR